MWVSEGLRLAGHIAPFRLAGRAALLLLALGLVQVLASVIFYAAIDRQTIREDHARRVAELLVVGERLHQLDPAAMPAAMTTRYLQVDTAPTPTTRPGATMPAVVEIERHILRWEPTLAGRGLALGVRRATRGRHDLVGSMQLADGAWLNFRSADISSGWPIALRATVMTLLITLASIVVAIYVLRRLMQPLRQLSEAVERSGGALPLDESGPADVRQLARSFNDLRERVSGLESERSRSFEAISHDLRTPLGRLKLAADFVGESDIAKIVSSSADEMEAMLMSLQSFLRAQHVTGEEENVDLVALIAPMLAACGDSAGLTAPAEAMIRTYREPLTLALQPLIENALQYGTRAAVTITPRGNAWRIAIADDGSGIPDELLEQILDPFFRVDSARSRNTAGFGLGIPTAHRLIERIGGKLSFANAEGGGLVARIDL